ncbi:SMP-30/gluconolactonase/LRE family protein [Owenweeksia hongkongensis]|uniref:SMP-30/gluconolactonase/LRE family protein n=1 Tax=Owenweeksia hongkongensis TaxID=253245 RepID=UPI003A8EE727
MKKSFLLFGGLIMLAACGQQSTEEKKDPAVQEPAIEERGAKEPSLSLVWETDTSLTTNESVLSHEGVLYVSNIAGKPTDKDGVGFISKVDMDGQVTDLKWAKGLDAPKGMGVQNDKLYVTNITELVEINLADGKITKRYPVSGSEFLNDIAILDNKVYFSDMNTGKLHVLGNGQVTTLVENHEALNGLAVSEGKLYGLDAKGLHQFSLDGKEHVTINDEVTGGDGLIVIDENTFVASRWKGEIWMIKDGLATKMLDSKDQDVQTADIAYIPEEKLVLVPRFFSNKVSAYRLDY